MPCSSVSASSGAGARCPRPPRRSASGSRQIGLPSAASRARRSSAAASRRDTTCPGRSAGSRRARSGRAAGGSACRPAPRLVGPTASVFHSRALEVVDRDEGRLAAHGQAHIARRQLGVDLLAQRVERRPGFVGEGLGDARMLGDAVDLHVEVEVDLGEARDARDRRGVAVMRRGRQRNVALARQQARGRVEPDPARAGQVDLAPGMQVGEVDARCPGGRRAPRGRASAGSDSPRRSARRSPRWRRHLTSSQLESRQEPVPRSKRLLRRLHAGLHADDVADLAARRARSARRRSRPCASDRAGSVSRKRCSSGPAGSGCDRSRGRRAMSSGYSKGQVSAAVLDEEVERVVDRHVGDEIDLDLQLASPARERQTAPASCRTGPAGGSRNACPALTFSECEITRVRECGAGRRRMTCGPSVTGRSYL